MNLTAKYALMCVLLFAASILSAQTTEQAASKEEVKLLIEVLRVKQMMTQQFQIMRAGMQSGVKESLKQNPTQLTPEQVEKASLMFDDIFKIMSVDEMLDELLPVYQKHFTSQEVRGIVAFYSSPAGQKLLDKQPQLMADGAAVGEQFMKRKMPEVQRLMKERMEEFLKSHRSDSDPK